MEHINIIIDFDSTLITLEGLDELAAIALAGNPRKHEILTEITEITRRGMAGEIPFDVSLSERLALFSASRKHIDALVRKLRRHITPSIERNKKFFAQYRDHIYILSGGFREYIAPLFRAYGIRDDHILANEFTFDAAGTITGFNEKSYLSKKNGKVLQIKALGLTGKTYVLGDGYTDYQIKKAGLADRFYVFCENVKRENVISEADHILPNFDEFLYVHNFPRAYSYPKNRIRVLLLENIHPAAVEMFEREGYVVETEKRALSEAELMKRLRTINILGIRSKTSVSRAVLAKAKRLHAVGAFCIGTNQIDLSAAAERGIAVFNAPYSNTRSVVELAIGEIIMLMRGIVDKNAKLHMGEWDKSAKGSHEVRGRTLGIIGYGNIGSQLSVIAEHLGMDVYYYDIADKLALGNARKCTTLKELMHVSDVVTVHVDGRKENRNLIGAKEVGWMREGALFLNLSRGFVVDQSAVADALRSGKLGGAAVDVFPSEPSSNDEKLTSPLQGIPNVILTPHIAGSTAEAQLNIGQFVAEKLITYINTGSTTLSVNMPQLQLPRLQNAHRFIHIHANRPGVLARINGILSEHSVNIEGQYLQTNAEIGYVITDVNQSYTEIVVGLLKALPDTIKFRVLY